MKYKPRRTKRIVEGTRGPTAEEVAVSEQRARKSMGRRKLKTYKEYLEDKKGRLIVKS